MSLLFREKIALFAKIRLILIIILQIIVSCFVLLLENVSCQFDEFPSFFNEFTSDIKSARDPRLDSGELRDHRAYQNLNLHVQHNKYPRMHVFVLIMKLPYLCFSLCPLRWKGPVLFPQAPIPPDTSGVRVGASGFGFVPPGGQGRVGSYKQIAIWLYNWTKKKMKKKPVIFYRVRKYLHVLNSYAKYHYSYTHA